MCCVRRTGDSYSLQLLRCVCLVVVLAGGGEQQLVAQQSREGAETTSASTVAASPLEIRVVDAETGRGVPLVLLTTTTQVSYVTDNFGRIAYLEPQHAGEQIFFSVEAHGYEVPKDGFGIAGVRVTPQPGQVTTIRLKRLNLAERLYRITGDGLYRDSLLLGYEAPLQHPHGTGKVMGQDSVQVALYRGKIRWFWGDTNRLAYSLGLFRTAGATSPLPESAPLPIEQGLELQYFTREDGFARAMIELPEPEGVIWIDGVCTVLDEATGEERLVAHYSRRKGLGEQYAHGMAVYEDERDIFVRVTELPAATNWQHLSNHPIEVVSNGQKYLQSGTPFPLTRVPATYAAVMDATRYESWTCLAADADSETSPPLRRVTGELDWQWRVAPPVTPAIEARWLKAKLIRPEEAFLSPADAARPNERLRIHTGTVHWNPYRKRWIMLASEMATRPNTPSYLGEIWYAEAPNPHGPFQRAVKVLTHHKQTFYNTCQHPFFDDQAGRVIYFEGTYTNSFTQALPTPRYDYNQILYRLDLAHPHIREVFDANGNN